MKAEGCLDETSFTSFAMKNLTPSYRTPLSLVRRGELGAPTPLGEWGLGAGGEVAFNSEGDFKNHKQKTPHNSRQ
jgi:hypothetical protein